MSITWKYVKPLKDTASVKKFLNMHHIVLPGYLIRILEKYNGGRPSENRVVTSTNEEYTFKSLLSYNEEDIEDIYSIYPDMFGKTKLFPIGSDVTGNFICFKTDSKILILWNHETNKIETITEIPFLEKGD